MTDEMFPRLFCPHCVWNTQHATSGHGPQRDRFTGDFYEGPRRLSSLVVMCMACELVHENIGTLPVSIGR